MMRLSLCLCLIAVVLIQGSLSASANSCSGRCGSRPDNSKSCQCNSACTKYGDCCSDYKSQCSSGSSGSSGSSSSGSGSSGVNPACGDFGKLTEELWANDVARLSVSDVTVNDQAFVEKSRLTDQSPEKLFSYVNDQKLNSAIYRTYRALLDNYDRDKYDPEDYTNQEKREEDEFLDVVMSTATIKSLYEYLRCQGRVQDMADMRRQLRSTWFDMFKRSPKSRGLDTSAFEHIMVGEWKSRSSATGFHYWLNFYIEEQKGAMNYFGHSCTTYSTTMCAAYDWEGRKKLLSSFFLRSSPAFDMAVYSACFFLYPGKDCRVVVEGRSFVIKSYKSNGFMTTAFVV